MEKWHSFSIEEAAEKLGTNKDKGLILKEVYERQKKFGRNKLPEEKSLSSFKIFAKQFQSPLIYILVLAGIVSIFFSEKESAAFLGKYADSIVIFSAVFLNSFVGFVQENKASRTLQELKKVIHYRTGVLRERNLKVINTAEIVPGDIIILNPGDKIPADGRLIEVHNLRINESALTGESFPAEKTIEILPKETPLADRDNMVYMGTVIEEGKGKAIVTATGAMTEIGKIALMAREAKEEKTPYQKKLADFSQIVGIIIGLICILIFSAGLLKGESFKEMFTTSVALAVASIPEGLPVAMTIILTLGMHQILKRKGLVRRLSSVETLGSTSIIATDKTGTLTEGKMKVDELFGNKILALKSAVLNSEAFIENFDKPKEKWVFHGRPTDRALLIAGTENGLDKQRLDKKEPRIEDLPFDPIYKYSATLRRFSAEENMLYILGSPEKILSMSKYFNFSGREEILSESKSKEIEEMFESFAKAGKRVLGSAYRRCKARDGKCKKLEDSLKNLVFCGLTALSDSLRSEVKDVIEICRKAGMRPIIVTGDHKLTARAIAKELGLPSDEKNIIKGADLDKISDLELQKRLENIEIYARVEPRHKIRIVMAWQKKGEVVAMTGDGINDAPALKKADIGVALGSGTEVAKETADLILLNDSFSIIVAAVEEGRAIIDNIRKVITYLFCSAFTEVVLIGASVIAGWPLPISAVQILWINLIEDGPLSLALAFEPKEKDLMKQKPAGRNIPLLTREMKILICAISFINIVLLLGLSFWLMNYSGYAMSHSRSVIFAALAIGSIFYIFSCKNLRKNIWHMDLYSNQFLILSWLFSVLFLLAGLNAPLFQSILKTEILTPFDWKIILGLGFLNLVLVELMKWIFISKKNKKLWKNILQKRD